ncbi:unnamed protein product [Effrenium voratum]|uniref:Vesicle transport protein n=1 Tax=Effrenium voratum TaxID=2562239 RepID=A0AA36I1D0_9DINO|nr:unnamed protein product [Effrenium voratum]
MAGMYGFAQDAPQTPPRRSQMAPAYVDEPMPVPSRAFQVSQASQLGRQLKRPPHAAPGAFLEASGPEAVVGIVQESFNRWLRDISSEGYVREGLGLFGPALGSSLCGIGVLCVTLGVFLLFDRTLLALGNVAFLFGLALLLGPTKAFKFFFRKEKWKGTTGYFVGIAIIIVGWPFVGFLTEMYGIWKLFAAFLPNVLASLKMTVPGAATVLNMWPLSSLCNLINDQRRLPV